MQDLDNECRNPENSCFKDSSFFIHLLLQTAQESDRQLAYQLDQMAGKINQNSISNLFRAEKYLKRAIELYRNGGASKKGEEVQRKLLSIQKEIT